MNVALFCAEKVLSNQLAFIRRLTHLGTFKTGMMRCACRLDNKKSQFTLLAMTQRSN